MSDEKVDRRRGPRNAAGTPITTGVSTKQPVTLQVDPHVEPVPQSNVSDMAHPMIVNADPSTATNEVKTIHFVEDGHTALGKVWYRGEELRLEVGSPQYEETVDRLGNTWLDMDEDTQIDLFGVVKFRQGPWRGKGYDSAVFEDGAISPEELKRLEKRRQRESRPPAPVSS